MTRGAQGRQPTVRPIQRLTAGRIGSAFITLDSADSVFAGFALAAFAAFGFAAVPLAVAGAVFFFGFSSAVVRAAGFAAFFAPAAAFGATLAAAFFAGALPAAFFPDAFLPPLAAMPFLPVPGALLMCFARPTASDTMRPRMWKRRRRHFVRALASTLALALCAARAEAREVTFPIRLDDRFLTAELARNAFTEPDGAARVFDDASDCNSLVLFDPQVEARPDGLRVRSAGEARFGVSVGGRCLLPLGWSGRIELVEEPRVARDAPVVRFVVTDSHLLNDDGGEPLFSGTLWGWVKDYVHPRLETSIDLAEPVAQLREVLPAFGVGEPGSALDEALASVTLDDVVLSDGEVEVRVRIDLPDRPETSVTPEPAGTVAPLSEDEIRGWQQALQQWDAFLTFVVKVTGADTRILELRRTLLSILLEERYALSEALASPDADVDDPVRPLFLRAWTRLAPALREVADGLPADQALRYVSFVSAGDALQALDQAGPDSGIEISADGLRRLARLVAPSAAEDPLAWTPGVDPQLRELFGFGPPLPGPEENPDVDAEAGAAAGDEDAVDDAPAASPDAGASPAASPAIAATPIPSPVAADAPDAVETPADAIPAATTAPSSGAAPSPSAAPPPDPAPSPGAAPAAASWLRELIGGTAWAAEPPADDDQAALAKTLNAWAPTRADIAEYAPLARRLLDSVTEWLLARGEIDPAHVAVFRALVPATAWKESCWRQYVRKGGKLVPLTSPAGAVGIMQVNVSVWRGFYDPGGLRRDIAYNARAGGEILTRYWTGYAVPRGEAAKGGGIDALARATYAAYNGGPGALRRYRDAKATKRERAVDGDFFAMYQRMKAGDALAVTDCYGV